MLSKTKLLTPVISVKYEYLLKQVVEHINYCTTMGMRHKIDNKLIDISDIENNLNDSRCFILSTFSAESRKVLLRLSKNGQAEPDYKYEDQYVRELEQYLMFKISKVESAKRRYLTNILNNKFNYVVEDLSIEFEKLKLHDL
jgi:hypothetical protein